MSTSTARSSTRRSPKFPETDLRFVLNGIDGPQRRHRRHAAQAVGRAQAHRSIKLKPLVQAELSKIEGVQAFAFTLPPLPGSTGGLPVQMVINSTAGFQAVYEQMAEAEGRRAQERPVHRRPTAISTSTSRWCGSYIDRAKANDLGITMAQVGATLATLLGGNYVNRFNLEGRCYQVIPQVPRGNRLTPEALGSYYVADQRPGSWCRCRPSCRSRPAPSRTR